MVLLEKMKFSQQNPIGCIKDSNKYIGMSDTAKLRNVFISGLDSQKKEEFLHNMIVQDINHNKGVVVLDPIGNLVDSVLDKVSTARKDIYLLDASNMEFPFGLNLIEIHETDNNRRDINKLLITDFCVGLLLQILYPDNKNERIKDFLHISCHSVLDGLEKPTLLDVFLFVTSLSFRDTIIKQVKREELIQIWNTEFVKWNTEDLVFIDTLKGLVARMESFMKHSMLSPILFQKTSTISIEDIVNEGGVILCKFSRNDMGIENVNIMSSILLFKMQLAAMNRVTVPLAQRKPCFFYVHHFHSFSHNKGTIRTLAEFLSECRRYHVGLVLHHPYLDQIKRGYSGSNFLIEAILNNCGTTITFKPSGYDATFWGEYYTYFGNNTFYTKQDLVNLKENEFIGVTLQENGARSNPFLATVVSFPNDEVKKSIIQLSNSLQPTRREEIAESIHRMMEENEN